jgi:hypothetical protein
MSDVTHDLVMLSWKSIEEWTWPSLERSMVRIFRFELPLHFLYLHTSRMLNTSQKRSGNQCDSVVRLLEVDCRGIKQLPELKTV